MGSQKKVKGSGYRTRRIPSVTQKFKYLKVQLFKENKEVKTQMGREIIDGNPVTIPALIRMGPVGLRTFIGASPMN